MDNLNDDQIRQVVRENYAKVAETSGTSCGCGTPVNLPMIESSCCSSQSVPPQERPVQDSTRMGYSAEDLASVPQGADMGLDCGNPELAGR